MLQDAGSFSYYSSTSLMTAFCGGPHEKSNIDQRLNKQNNQLEGFLNGAFLLLLYTSAPINPFFLAWMICYVRAMEIITQNTKQEGSEMSGAQMAHFLKQVGNGSELEGIVTVYRTGMACWRRSAGDRCNRGPWCFSAWKMGLRKAGRLLAGAWLHRCCWRGGVTGTWKNSSRRLV